ncbi:MAG: hypothetical protein KAS32_12400 [Candidatus Peribacteraceae bacterium]|nr:hypothetical protein [Candidatus Peribacteraceae bacterium]
MQKLYRPLTDTQKANGVIFSSTLSEHETEQDTDKVHEIHKDDDDAVATETRLRNDKVFEASHFKYNIIRQ